MMDMKVTKQIIRKNSRIFDISEAQIIMVSNTLTIGVLSSAFSNNPALKNNAISKFESVDNFYLKCTYDSGHLRPSLFPHSHVSFLRYK